MNVARLYRYPVKSLGGHSVESIRPLPRGFEDDRRWMFVDVAGRFISQRNNVQLAKFSAQVSGDNLTFTHLPDGERIGEIRDIRATSSNEPGREAPRSEVTVWDDTFMATEIRSDALYHLTRKLGIPDARLMYMSAADDRPIDPRYAKAGASVSFADGYPYLFTTTASLADLDSRLGDGELDERRFRPNVVVDTEDAWSEDDWTRLSVGDHKFRLPKPCARCIMVTHEPGTGGRDLRVLAELAKYRKVDNKILFGMNACWAGGVGLITVGDSVEMI